ncbi:hypothetical protein Tco_0758245, partial [Tanacetum coccineum]
ASIKQQQQACSSRERVQPVNCQTKVHFAISFRTIVSTNNQLKAIAISFSTWLSWYVVRKYDGYPKTSIPSNMDSFQLALEFGISVMVIAYLCALGLPNCSYGWY